jgi:hypothetical protein
MRLREQRRHGVAIFRNPARLGKIIEQRADLAIGGQGAYG